MQVTPRSNELINQLEREQSAMKIQAVQRGRNARAKLERRLSRKETGRQGEMVRPDEAERRTLATPPPRQTRKRQAADRADTQPSQPKEQQVLPPQAPGDDLALAERSGAGQEASDAEEEFLKQKIKAKAARLKKQSRGIATAFFVVASIFFLRTMVGGIDCSMNLDGKYYMDREPKTECNTDDPYYASVRRLSIIGMVCYALLFVVLVVAMAKGGQSKFTFLALKFRGKWFWWELVLLLRKVIIMVAALRTSERPEQGWFLCSLVLVLAISAHSFARPYMEDWLNACEYCSLFSTLLLFMAGMVFKVQSSHMGDIEAADGAGAQLASVMDNQTAEQGNTLAPLARALVVMAIGLIVGTTAMCLYAELRLLCKCCRCHSCSRKQTEALPLLEQAKPQAQAAGSPPVPPRPVLEKRGNIGPPVPPRTPRVSVGRSLTAPRDSPRTTATAPPPKPARPSYAPPIGGQSRRPSGRLHAPLPGAVADASPTKQAKQAREKPRQGP